MYGLALIAIIAIMGGVIAYIGDKLGTKVGKKKLSMFGLRPKHTSIIVTIITGILISAATLGIMTAISWDVRTALFGMEELKAELHSLTTEVNSKTTELEASRAALDAKNAEYTAISAKIKETTEQLSKITAELTEVMVERDRTIAALTNLQADYALAQRDLLSYQASIKSLQATKTELDKRVEGLNTQINELNTAKTELQTDVDRLNELTANLKKGLQIVREGTVVFRAGELLSNATIRGGQSTEATSRELAGVVYKTNQYILEKLNVADKKLEILWIAQSDFDQASKLISETDEEVIVRISTVGNTVYGEAVIGRIELFPNHLIYSRGDAVYSDTVTITSENLAEENVLSFLQKVNAAAVSKGILPDPIQGTVGSMSGTQLFETVSKVKRQSGKIELMAVAKSDTYTAGPLQIEIRIRSTRE
ncbi:MAG: smc 2 [Firmicutes bacterium]|nr:smc 2 [Bacillota bacterium]